MIFMNIKSGSICESNGFFYFYISIDKDEYWWYMYIFNVNTYWNMVCSFYSKLNNPDAVMFIT